MNLSDFTHRASFYGIPCYFNEDTGELRGRIALFDYLIPIAAWLHNYFIAPFYDDGFPIRLLAELDYGPRTDKEGISS